MNIPTMTCNTLIDDSRSTASIVSLSSLQEIPEMDSYEDLNEGDDYTIGQKRTIFGSRTNKDISMDLNDLLQEMEEERDETHERCDSSVSSGSISIGLNDEDHSPHHISSKLKLDDLPSSSRGLDWGSLNWGSFMGSFRKRMGGSSSRNNLHNSNSRGLGSSRKLGSSRRFGNSSRGLLRRMGSVKKSKSTTTPEKKSQPEGQQPERRRKKVVRFKKFETVFPSFESYANLHCDEGRKHDC